LTSLDDGVESFYLQKTRSTQNTQSTNDCDSLQEIRPKSNRKISLRKNNGEIVPFSSQNLEVRVSPKIL